MKVSQRFGLIAVSALGLGLVLYGLRAAVAANILWYDFFTVGVLLFLAPISYQICRDTLLTLVFRSPFLLLLVYLIFFFVGFAIELCGTSVANLWYYPGYSRDAQAVHSLIIGYPFALLSLIPLFELIEHGVRVFTKKSPPGSRAFSKSLKWPLFIAGIVLVLLPIVDRYVMSGTYVRQLSLLGMIGGILLFDLTAHMIGAESLISELRSGRYEYLVALISVSWLAGIVHEVPNTIPNTWVYHGIPFTQVRLLGVNVIVLFAGWVFLTLVAVSTFRIVKRLSSHELDETDSCLEQPATALRLPYVVFWSLIALLLVGMRFALLRFVGVDDPYFVLTLIMALGLVWIAGEIIWSYRGLLRLKEVVSVIAGPSDGSVVDWYEKWVVSIYTFRNMALTGVLVAGLFSPLIFKQQALHWTGSQAIVSFDVAFYLLVLFLGGMSQYPFYGMSILALALPSKPFERRQLFLAGKGDVRRFGHFFALVGMGGLGLIAIAQVWLYIAPVQTVWLYVQLIVSAISVGAILWFLLTQYNVHKLIVGQKKRYLDKVCTELNNIFQNAIEHPSDKHYRRVSVLSSLKTHIENIPDWPFSTISIVRLVTTAGAVAALIPAIEFFRKLLEKP